MVNQLVLQDTAVVDLAKSLLVGGFRRTTNCSRYHTPLSEIRANTLSTGNMHRPITTSKGHAHQSSQLLSFTMDLFRCQMERDARQSIVQSQIGTIQICDNCRIKPQISELTTIITGRYFLLKRHSRPFWITARMRRFLTLPMII